MLLVESLHWAIALTPVLVLLGIFVWLDAFALMSLREIGGLLLLGALGALIAWPISGRMLDTLPIGFSLYSRFIAPWIEEAIKAAIMIALFRFNRIGYKLDAVISGFAIGAGFSVVENIFYLTIFPNYGTGTWLVRGFGTAIMHGTTLALLAAIAHEFAERETRSAAADYDFNLLWFIPGYGVAVALHTAFNQFPNQPMAAMMGALVIAPIALIAILNFGTSEAQGWLASECAEHRAQVQALRKGLWPNGPAGDRISKLASRLDDQSVARVRRYWELQAWLVAEAEETLLEEAAGDAEFDSAEVRSAFAELDGLKRALGPSTFAALQSLLPFSKNDFWEVAELKQRLVGR
ncbi:PrsW family glutamic-type intramembrane protease [Sphingomonas flavescens]|uniref:PrsW family glutamic-type intramembrane protease n=1 Tax=Sphingomonas flavescens TaxID=3132797 RepID=UPI00280575F4|nr:PrsW family glutamic-type intramembrane protease [Sphingomonas limnosediminicola]